MGMFYYAQLPGWELFREEGAGLYYLENLSTRGEWSWRCGSRGREPTLHAGSREIKP
jgi:hypothetical protein